MRKAKAIRPPKTRQAQPKSERVEDLTVRSSPYPTHQRSWFISSAQSLLHWLRTRSYNSSPSPLILLTWEPEKVFRSCPSKMSRQFPSMRSSNPFWNSAVMVFDPQFFLWSILTHSFFPSFSFSIILSKHRYPFKSPLPPGGDPLEINTVFRPGVSYFSNRMFPMTRTRMPQVMGPTTASNGWVP